MVPVIIKTKDKSKKTKGGNYMKYIGAHVSASGGVEHAPLNANSIGAKAFALFTKNQRQWFSNPLTKASIKHSGIIAKNMIINHFRYFRMTVI
jgi:endonuclease IV